MKKLFFILILYPFSILGQISEDFNDADLLTNPTWFGKLNKFTVNNNLQLQLQDIEAGQAWISTPYSINDSIEWSFTTKLSFSPSSNNNCRVYLLSDTENPTESNHSVFLQLGESGSEDAPELFHKDENGTHSILRFSDALINSSFEYQWKITYSSNNLWKLYYSPNCDDDFILLTSQYNEVNFNSQHFAIYCKYTISNATKFFFDNITVRHIFKDYDPPQLIDFQVQDSTTLLLFFNESIDTASILRELFRIEPGNINPCTLIYDSYKKAIQLKFTSPFQANSPYQIHFFGLQDIEGNTIDPISKSFTYYPPYKCQCLDVVIHELMVDINPPPIELPPYDYIELYNRSDNEIDLSKFRIQFGASEKEFPCGTIIQANDYLIITDDESGLENYGSTCFLNNLNINNECLITLFDSLGNLIHYVDYDKTWYQDSEKAKGGWALEMINPNYPCNAKENWVASTNPSGGTPGSQNTSYEIDQDTTHPSILSIKCLDENTLELAFEECLHPLDSILIIEIHPGNYHPSEIRHNFPLNNSYVLRFENKFIENESYTLYIKSEIQDCSGNMISELNADFINHQAQHLDLIITEFMYDTEPAPNNLPAMEYIELYNNSDFTINIKGWTIQFSTKFEKIIQNYILEPQEYLILCENDFEEINSIPIYGLSLSNSGGILALYSDQNNLIHHLDWSPKWMDEDWKSEGGWSLEMIDIDAPCTGNTNWTASKAQKGGSPGAINSVDDELGDYTCPNLIRANVINRNKIRLDFSEAVFIPSIFSNNISLSGHQIINKHHSDPIPQMLYIEVSPPLIENQEYNIKIHDQLCDCAGNTFNTKEIILGIPNQHSINNLIINEVLFNSHDKSGDFIELYNNSEYFLELHNIIMEIKGKEPFRINEDFLQLRPYEYFIICEDYEKVSKYYDCEHIHNYLELLNFNGLHNDSGFVKIYNQEMNIIDQMQYSASMHHPSILSPKGVSLERISFTTKGIQKSNWHSASTLSGWATPGKENSQMQNSIHSHAETLTVNPKVFSPNNDGYEDHTEISFHCEKPGYLAHIRIFNTKGKCVRFLKNNILCTTDNKYNWGGRDENGHLLPPDIYIIIISLLSPNGNQSSLKISCALHYTNKKQ